MFPPFDAQRWMQKLGEHHREERRKFARECGAKTEEEVDEMTECETPSFWGQGREGLPSAVEQINKTMKALEHVCGKPTGEGQKLGFYGEPPPTWEPGMDVRQEMVWETGIDAEWLTIDPRTRTVIACLVRNRHGVTMEFGRFGPEDSGKIDAACERLQSLLMESEQPLTMRDAIAQAADEAGCAREDLCSYLLALGIGSLR